MSNEVKNSEKKSKSIMRNSKAFRYSRNLMFIVGAMGVTTGVLLSNTGKVKANDKNNDDNLNNTVDETQSMLKKMRNRNKMYIRGANLELIQLMEQGDQIIKSPWSSWQFGMNFFSNANIVSEGYGDKQEKYTYNGLYFRNNWKMKNALATSDSMGVMGLPITPGNDSLTSWRSATGNVYSEMNFDTSNGSSVNGEIRWGLVELRKIQEPLNEVEILARISPKEVKKEAVSLNVAEPTVEIIEAPVINPQVNEPLTAPVITIPEVSVNVTPIQPSVSVSVEAPALNPLVISSPPVVVAPTVNPPQPTPVEFTISPAGDANKKASTWQPGWGNTINVTALTDSNRAYVTLNSVSGNVPVSATFNVISDDNRALVIDEANPGGTVNFSGTINLKKNKNVGIDLQGTHNGSATAPSILKVINTGTITGHKKDGNTPNANHIAFGFNNADASNNTTMTHMINRNVITLEAKESAGFQLKPEDPHNWTPGGPNAWQRAPLHIHSADPKNTRARILMKADNEKKLNIGGIGSFGMLTIFNKGVPQKFFDENPLLYENLLSERIYGGARVLPGGELGRSAVRGTDDANVSGMYNRNGAEINISGDKSVGIGLLQEIQEVKVAGSINIGLPSMGAQEDNISNVTGNNISKVEEAIGVFAGVPTRPLLKGETDSMGNILTTEDIVGTKTVELNGTINLGDKAENSIGALVGDREDTLNNGYLWDETQNPKQTDYTIQARKLKRSGDITANSDSKINVGGKNNYGFVVNNSAYYSVFDATHVDRLKQGFDKEKHGIGINAGKIFVTGEESIGFAMLKGGNSENKGTISVEGLAKKAIGVYGEKDVFTNTNIIQVISDNTSESKGIVINGDINNAGNPFHFINTGKIFINVADSLDSTGAPNTNLNGKGNIGVYAQGKYIFDYKTGSSMKVGSNAIGFYVNDNTGTVNVNAPVILSDSVSSSTSALNGTTIGFYSDGNANVNFGTGSKLTIGEKAVGIYSADSKKLSDTFKIKNSELLEVELGKNSAFALVSGNRNAGSPVLSKFLNINENPAGNGIKISSFGEGATLVYSNNGGKAILGEGAADAFSISNGLNKSTSILSASGIDSNNNKSVVGIAQNFTLTTNTKVALSSSDSAEAINEGKIISTRSVDNLGIPDSGVGIYANKSTGENASTGIIEMPTEGAVGIFGESNSTLKNSGKINTKEKKSVGIYAKDSNVTQSGTGTNGIYVDKESSAGIFSEITLNTAVTPNVTIADADKTVTNTGYIKILGENSAGIFGKLNAGTDKKLTINNSGKIEVANKNSAGIFANNLLTSSSPVGKLEVNNTGTINLKNIESVGIFASKSTVSGVGKITLDNAANKSIGVYAAAGSAITTTTAEIDLGKGTDQNRVAYYVKNKDTALTGTNIGEISGYGVGVYLEGTSATDVAELNASSTSLNYKTATSSGDGIIGLYLSGNTKISDYTGPITVGKTVEDNGTKYAIGIYAKNQGTSTSAYTIKTPITTGEKGIGIFAADKSVIKYNSGTIDVGANGIGIYVQKQTSANTTIESKVELGTGADKPTINLADGSVAAIVGENAHFDGGNATISLSGSGVGVYGLKGSVINVGNWTFNNNGHSAEEIRTKEGIAAIDNPSVDKDLKPGMVLSHVINGETYIVSGKTVKSIADGSHAAGKNIGLMAEGIKNPSETTWTQGNYEIVNQGTIDFTAGKESTALYAASARVKNDGTIKMGAQSTGIYGIYRSDSPHYHGGSSADNKLTVETTANSMMELGQESVGVYLKNASTGINLDGKITSSAGATKNVGIYMINEAGTQPDQGQVLTGMVNGSNSEIILGDGSVGLYSRGKGSATADRNTVTNNGKITVGKKIVGAPSVGIYAENTNLSTGTSSDVTVGEDGIAFYGKNSEITANGTVNFNNKGVLAYLENSKFVSHLGNISPTQNTMLYLKNSIAEMDGAGTKVDMTVADGYTGAYVEGNSSLTGVKTINLGRNSNGVFLKDAVFTSEIEEITGTQENAKGILGIDSSLTNKTKISLSGDNSIGIYSNADSTKTVVNEGNLVLSGKKTLGVFLKGDQSFENKADISIADSADSQNPVIGVYTSSGTSPITLTSGNIEVGVKSIGVYSTTNSPVTMTGGNLHVKDEGMGIYKQNGSVTLGGNVVIDPHTSTTPNTEPVGVYAVNGVTVNDSANVTVGEKSYGFILSNDDPSKVNVYTNTAGSNVTLGNDSTYLYSGGKAQITNNKYIATGNADRVIGFYIKGNSTGSGNFVNNGVLDFSTGKGNIAVYAPGSVATNSSTGKIYVGATDYTDPLTGKIYSDKSRIVYGIGMATDNGGHIANDGEIRIFGDKSIGMYGSGAGTVVENRGNILLDGSRAASSDKIESMTGVYVDEGAKFVNKGTIQTTDSYAGRNGMVNPNVSGLVGVAVMNGSTLVNEAGGKILIDADNTYGVVIRGKKNPDGTVQYATIKNYGEIKVRGKGTYGISWKDVTPDQIADLENQINSKITSDPKGQEVRGASGTDKEFEGIKISIKNGEPVFSRNGVPVSDSEVAEISKLIGKESNIGLSDIGFYVDTLGRTKPIDIDGATPPINSQLIIGTEYSEMTNSKYWVVKGDVIKPFLDQITGRNFKLTSLAGSLTWMATPILDSYGEITGVAMAKVPYTSFVKKTDNAWNFTDGLEQRYGVNSLDSREKQLFNKLNSIGKNESVLLTQAFDEMMGHQYANIQQRTHGTGKLIDKEITHLSKEWETKSKQSNKIKVFGMKDGYSTDTAGIIDYTSNAYGFAYLHENETIKLGNVSGWYAGAVTNKFKFKDIGGSQENQTMLKLGIFKTMSPFADHNGNLQWTISGEGYVSRNDMHRKYLVVDEIFNAKSDYTTYGVAVKNELGYNIRTSERTSIRPYGSLKLEYGRFSTIKEKSGEVRLDIKGNDYYSVKPEVGIEFNYRQPLAVKSIFTASLGLGYENEFGNVFDAGNKGRVSYTTADWFNIRGEKKNHKGNFKANLNFGLENSRMGLTLNTGYDSTGKNIKGGVGFRVIY